VGSAPCCAGAAGEHRDRGGQRDGRGNAEHPQRGSPAEHEREQWRRERAAPDADHHPADGAASAGGGRARQQCLGCGREPGGERALEPTRGADRERVRGDRQQDAGESQPGRRGDEHGYGADPVGEPAPGEEREREDCAEGNDEQRHVDAAGQLIGERRRERGDAVDDGGSGGDQAAHARQ